MPRSPDLPCADCGKLMWSGTTSLPAGEARCLPCRRKHPIHRKTRSYERQCPQCGTDYLATVKQKYCSNYCGNQSRIIRASSDNHVRRSKREYAAPGLTRTQRDHLRIKWKKQDKACHYCGKRGDVTLDHVLPLIRGGTNWEGNIVPACRKCNASKSGYTVIEWRTGMRLRPMDHYPWRERKKPTPRTPTQRHARSCAICGSPTLRRVYCSKECGNVGTRLMMRNKYRASRGLPLVPPLEQMQRDIQNGRKFFSNQTRKTATLRIFLAMTPPPHRAREVA